MKYYRRRRTIIGLLMLALMATTLLIHPDNYQFAPKPTDEQSKADPKSGPAVRALNQLAVKGRASKTGYTRSEFGDGWEMIGSCDMRNIILARDMTDEVIDLECKVLSGQLHDPYTDSIINFKRGSTTSALVQIDHVVALSDAWQKGAQQISPLMRRTLANDPLNLLAVDGSQNQKKSGSDAASWLPPWKLFRCEYVSRQIAVKQRYHLWVTAAEKNAIASVLENCPAQQLPKP